MQIRIIAFLAIYICAQQATETTAPILAGVLCLFLLDCTLFVTTKKGLFHHLKQQR